jgi:hypothetical protein
MARTVWWPINKLDATGIKPMKSILITTEAILLLATLSACSGGGGYSAAMAPATTPPTTMPAAVDAYTQSVQAIANTTSDLSVPLNIAGIAVVGPEDTQPIAVY